MHALAGRQVGRVRALRIPQRLNAGESVAISIPWDPPQAFDHKASSPVPNDFDQLPICA